MNTNDRFFSDWTSSTSNHSRSQNSHNMNPHTNFNQSSMYPLGSQWNMTSPHGQGNMPGSNPMSSRMLNSGLQHGLGLSYNPIMPYPNTSNSGYPTMHPSMNLPSGGSQNQFGMTETVQRGRDVIPSFPSMTSTHSPYLSQNDSSTMPEYGAYRYNSASDPLNTNRLMHSEFMTSERRSLSRTGSNTSALDPSAQMSFPLEQSQISSGSRSHLSADTGFMSRSQQAFDLPTRSEGMAFARSDYSSHMSAAGRSFGGLAHASSRQTEIPMTYAPTTGRSAASVASSSMEKSMTSNQSFWSAQPANTPSLPVTETTMSSQRDKTPYFPVTQSLPGSAPVPRGGGYGGGSSYAANRTAGQGSGSNVASPQSSYSNTPSMAASAVVTTASSYTTTSSARSQAAYSHMSPATTSAPSTPLGSAPPTTSASSIMPSSKPPTEQDSTSMPGSNQSYSMAPRTPATPSFTSGYSPTFTTATTATTTMSPYTAPRSNDSVTSGNYRGPSSVQSTASNHSAAIKQKTPQVNTSPLQDTHVSDGIKAADIPMHTEILKQQATPEKMSPDDGASGLPPFTDVIQTLESTISRLPQASPGQSSEIQQAMRQLKLLMSVHSMMDTALKDDGSIQQEQSSTDKREAQSSSENSEDEQREEMLFKEGVRRPVDLPRELTLKIDEQLQISVWAKQEIPMDTEFGPYQGRLTTKFLPTDTRDKWLVMGPDYNSLALLQPLDDLEAELPPNWLRYISPASSYQDQNCMLVKTENTRYMIKVVRDIGPNQELFAIHNEEFATAEPEPEEEEEETVSQEILDIPDPLEERSEERRPSDSSMPQLEAEEEREIANAILPEDFDSPGEFSLKRELSEEEEVEEDVVEEEEEEEESPRKSKRRKLLAAEPDVPADIGMIDPNDILPEEPKEEKPKRKSRKKKKEAPPSEREESASASESRTPSPVKPDRKRRSRRDKSKVEEVEEKMDIPAERDDSPPPTPQFEKKKEKKRTPKADSPDKKETVKRKRQREASAESKQASDRESEPEGSDDEKVKVKSKKEKEKEKDDSEKRTKRKWTHREFTCEVCGETIRYVTKFDRHMMEKHGISEPWKCEHCPTERKFRLYATLEKHILTIHPDISFNFEKTETPNEKKAASGEKEVKTKRTRKSKKCKGEINDVTPAKETEVDKGEDRGSDSDDESAAERKTKYEKEMEELHKSVKHLKTKDKRDNSSEKKKGTKSGGEKKRKKSKKDKSSSQGEPSQDESEETEKKVNAEIPNDDDEDSEVMRKLSFGQDIEPVIGLGLDKVNDSNGYSEEDRSPLFKIQTEDRLARQLALAAKADEPIAKDGDADDKLDDEESDDGEKEDKGEKTLDGDGSTKKKRKHRKLSFTCEECDESFKWTTKYMKHMSDIHGVTKPFKCEKCNNISFGTYQNYERHCQSKHDPNNSSSSRRAWTKHHFKCEVCGENIIHATKFDKHMFEKHGVVKPWKCNQCDQAFRLLSSLRNHINYVHEQIARPKSGKSRDSTSSTAKKDLSNADKGQAYELDILEERNKDKGDDSGDEPLGKKGEDDTDVDEVNSSPSEINDTTNEDATSEVNKKKKKGGFKKSGGKKYASRQFTCHLCQENVTSVTGFEKHMLEEHQIDNCWQCKRCSVAPFRLFNGLQQHMRNMHTGDQESKSVLCELCGRSFKSEENLKRHMRVHLDTLPFLCSLCDKSFAGQASLQAHLDKEHVTHPDAFKCDKCLKVHTSQELLDRHRDSQECTFTKVQFAELKTDDSTVVYRESRERIQCSHCDQMVLKQDYDDHVNTHTGNKPHECSECGRGFAHRAGLNLHMKQVHTGEKNYKCDICGKAFKLKSYLRQHMVTHSSEKPHVCSICGKGFTRKAFMKKHERRHQENKESEEDKDDAKEEEEDAKEPDNQKDEKDEEKEETEKEDGDDYDKSEGQADEDNESTEK